MTTSSSVSTPHLNTEFMGSIGSVLQAYFAGDYQLARDRAMDTKSSVRDHEWRTIIADGLAAWLTDWDAVKAARPLVQFVNDHAIGCEGWNRVGRFYAAVFATLICCGEARNLLALEMAEQVASSVDRDVDSDLWAEPDIAEVLGERAYQSWFLPPWSLYWFRAMARSSLGKASSARRDWDRAYNRTGRFAFELPSESRTSDDQSSEGRSRGLGDQRKLLRTLQLAAEARCQVLGRMFHDLAVFCFQQGDWGWNPETGEHPNNGYGAEAFFDVACGVSENPYTLSGRAEFLSYARLEDQAVKDVDRAINLIEKSRGGKAIGPDEGQYFASGRAYFQAGMLTYKYRYRERVADKPVPRKDGETRIKAFESAVANAVTNERLRAAFTDDTGERSSDFFRLSAQCYFAIKDPIRALPALIMMTDPLRETADTTQGAARQLIWDFVYGFGSGFVEDLVHYENLVAQYFARDILVALNS
jgi:hypothetical protein